MKKHHGSSVRVFISDKGKSPHITICIGNHVVLKKPFIDHNFTQYLDEFHQKCDRCQGEKCQTCQDYSNWEIYRPAELINAFNALTDVIQSKNK